MRLLLLGLVVALAVPANAVAGGRVSAFYYPWYGTYSADGSYRHWSQDGHAPPNDIASAYYPAIGLYSSSDKLVIDAQMSEIRGAGIDEIAVSWWGRGSPEDQRMPAIRALSFCAQLRIYRSGGTPPGMPLTFTPNRCNSSSASRSPPPAVMCIETPSVGFAPASSSNSARGRWRTAQSAPHNAVRGSSGCQFQ